jgi:hypothetical protein
MSGKRVRVELTAEERRLRELRYGSNVPQRVKY